MKIKATIYYYIDEQHPDIDYIDDPTKCFSFTDTYIFNSDYSREDAKWYIKRDLLLVAGGGYNSDHVHNESFVFE